MSFDDLGLSAEILRAVHASGYDHPTPIQEKAIPVVLQGRDVMGAAQTGTGKTAGFTLPILENLSSSTTDRGADRKRAIRALILTPTRELAAQVGESVRTYGRNLPLRSAIVFGGVKINPQIEKLRQGVDILISTPGRLLDHLSQRTVDLSRVEILVLDEADRMLDMGFIRDIKKIMAALPRPGQRQTLLFSATFSAEIIELSKGLLHNPEMVEVASRNATADKVDQAVYLVDKSRKRELLSHLISSKSWSQVLVFTRTKHGANRLSDQLQKDGIDSAAIHGNKSQGARTRALAEFKSGKVQVLVATDIAARGLDIDQLPHVVNFELPNVSEDYVHRIGRTARAGRSGEAVSLVDAEEHGLLRDIERLLKQPVPRLQAEGFEPSRSTPAGKPANSRNHSRGGRGNTASATNKPKAGQFKQNSAGKRNQSGQNSRHSSAGRRAA